jgi:hypothetical protein
MVTRRKIGRIRVAAIRNLPPVVFDFAEGERNEPGTMKTTRSDPSSQAKPAARGTKQPPKPGRSRRRRSA